MPPAGCRWARGRSADVIEVGKGAGARHFPGCVESGQLCPRTRLRCTSFVLVGPTFRLMRGHIVGPAFRCLYGCWAQPSGLLCLAGGSVTGALVQILRSGLNHGNFCHSWNCVQMTGADPGMTIRNLVDTGVSPGRRFQFLFIGLGAGHLGAYSTMFHPAIPAYHQVLHLRISLHIHLHRGVI